MVLRMATLQIHFVLSISKFVMLTNIFISTQKMSTQTLFDDSELNNSKIHIKDRNNVNKILTAIVQGGKKQLQLISDFDRTITKQHEKDKTYYSSFGIFSHSKSVPQSYLEYERRLTKKYFPIEIDPNIPRKEKIKLMEEWWALSEQALKGLVVPPEDIDDIAAEIGPALRDGTCELFNDLNDLGVPILVFSAGLGDSVVAVLKHFNVLLDNVKVVSNFLKYDEFGVIQGFNADCIHVFNKNEDALRGTEYYHTIEGRSNVILLGDSIGDVTMAEGVPHVNAVLKIGFLYDHIKENLPAYMDLYDIVLEDDQTMDVVRAILKNIV